MGGEDALHGAAPAVDSEVSVADSGASEEVLSEEAELPGAGSSGKPVKNIWLTANRLLSSPGLEIFHQKKNGLHHLSDHI